MTDLLNTSSSWQARIDMLRRRRKLFLSTVIGTFLTLTAFVIGLPHLYRAKATLLVLGGSSSVLQTADGRNDANARLQAIKEEALSRARLTGLIRQFGLYGYGPKDDIPESAVARMQRDVRTEVTSTDQSPNGPSAVAFTLSYVGKDPQVAADVTNALASFYVAQNDQMRVQQASVASDLLGEQLEEARKRLQAQEAQIRNYVSSNVGALPQQIDSNLAAVARLDGQMRLNNTEQMRLLERRAALQNQIAMEDSRVPDATDTDPQARLSRMKADLTSLRTRFSSDHPDVRAKEAEIQALQREIETTPARAAVVRTSSPKDAAVQSLKDVESELARLDQENEQLKGSIASVQQRLDRGASHVPLIDALMSDYQSTRDLYDAAQKRYAEAQLAKRAEQGPGTREYKILDPALPPATSTGPSRLVLVGLGALIALAVGVLVLLIRQGLDPTFHSIDELRAFTSLPILASIPVLAATPPQGGRLRSAVMASATTVAIVGVAISAFHLAHGCEQVVRVLSRVG
jgi:polysaccharide chain length determinant protein (PEP-CTERM system associated)